MLAVVTLVTDEVVIVKVAVVLPAATVTLAGTTADVLLLSETAAPPLGAGLFSVTVPVELLPAVTLVGFTLTAVRLATGVMVSEACTVVEP